MSRGQLEFDREAIARAAATFASSAGSFVKFAEAIRRTAASMRHYRQRWVLGTPPEPHAFTPDFDLCCTVTGCNLLPEEH